MRHTHVVFLTAAAIVALTIGCGSGSAPVPTAASSSIGASLSPVSSAPSLEPSPSLTPFPVFGPAPIHPVDAATAGRLQAAVDQIFRSAPDAIAAVITPAGTWAGAAGVDGPKDRPAKSTDEFAIASVTKTITAAMVLKLADEGKIDLDAPIAQYVKDLGADGNGATVRQVVGMRSGMGDTRQSFFDDVYAHCDRTWTKPELVATFGDPVGPPGTEHYSNPSYKLLGFAVENVTGLPLATAFRSVLDPAGGDRILLQTAESTPPKPFALPTTGHEGEMHLAEFGKGGALPCLAYASGSVAASGIASDAPSLARWAWALAAGEVVGPERLTMMANGYGLDPLPDLAAGALGHSGSQPGYGSVLAILPDQKAVVVLFENDADLDVVNSAGVLARALEP